RRQQAALLQRFHDRAPPRIEFRELHHPVAHGLDLHFVERPRRLLAIAGNEGNVRALGEHLGGGRDGTRGNAGRLRDGGDVPGGGFVRNVGHEGGETSPPRSAVASGGKLQEQRTRGREKSAVRRLTPPAPPHWPRRSAAHASG